MRRFGRPVRFLLTAAIAVLILTPAVLAQLPSNPLNDLLALGQGSGQTLERAPIQ
jgi:hypothetical protein